MSDERYDCETCGIQSLPERRCPYCANVCSLSNCDSAAAPERSHYERTHWVQVYGASDEVKSCIYDPRGNAMTYGELRSLINELQDECQELKDAHQPR